MDRISLRRKVKNEVDEMSAARRRPRPLFLCSHVPDSPPRAERSRPRAAGAGPTTSDVTADYVSFVCFASTLFGVPYIKQYGTDLS
ncbi:hypothetical protein EVAR_37130_1 [Eumeta japonica]|uniref:Uncharacterized protein n=1 Tax=Eumeta variegata TaxID=151549 RepID=A0A4C1XQM5_EUMVA|nr:hypothetical protein EVAR_37130_1 [Eumeta japonica]